MRREEGFKIFGSKRPKVLILGSFPGVPSLDKKEYYANKANRFWTILGKILGEVLTELSYRQKEKVLRKHKIALWDVIHSCKREGSLDSKIRDAKYNDFSKIVNENTIVLCNGKKSHKDAIKAGLNAKYVPSTSPANQKGWNESIWIKEFKRIDN